MQSTFLRPSCRVIYSHTALRGIAALSVVMHHFSEPNAVNWIDYKVFFGIFHWGSEAVDLFFILSGFILHWVYLLKVDFIDWSAYLRARVARIMPLYYLTTVLCLPVALFSIFKHGLSYVGRDYPATLLCNALMFSGIVDGFRHTINSPAWSISVEFFCYLAIFPLLVCLFRFLSTKSFGLLGSIILVGIFTHLLVICYQFAPLTVYGWHWDSSWLVRGICGFSSGFFICAIHRMSPHRGPSRALINLMVIGAFAVFFLNRLGYLPTSLLLYSFPFLVYFSAYDEGASASILKSKSLQWLGQRSYSIYLWHMPILLFQMFLFSLTKKSQSPSGPLSCAILVVIVLLISELSYRYFETPCREYMRKLPT